MPYIVIFLIYLILSWFIIQELFFKKNKKMILYPIISTLLFIVGSFLFVLFVNGYKGCNEGCVFVIMGTPVVSIINFICTFVLASFVYEGSHKTEVKFRKIFWLVFIIALIAISYPLLNYLITEK